MSDTPKQDRRRILISYGMKTLVTLFVTFSISFLTVYAFMKPSVGVNSLVSHFNPAFLQDLLNARLTGLSKSEISDYLATKSDASLRQAEIILRSDLMRPVFSHDNGVVVRKMVPWRSYDNALADPPVGCDRSRESMTWQQFAGFVYAYLPQMHAFAPTLDKAYFIVIPIDCTPYAVLLRRDFHEIPYFQFSTMVVTISIVMLILLVGTLILLAPGFRRVHSIEEVCRRISNGDYSKRINDTRRDSLGLLAQHVDAMADAIDKNFDRQRSLLQAVSHELRTPLARIRFKLEMLDVDETCPKVLERLESIDDDFSEIDALLKELGYFNYLEAKKGQTIFETADIYALLTETLKHRNVVLKGFNVEIVAPDTTVTAQVDPTAFKRSIGNLLANSARYAQKSIELHMQLSHNRDAVEITVEDDGPGIPADKRQFVFEPFSTIDKSRAKSQGGAGLGLAIVKRIIMLHHGTISIEDSALGGAKIVTTWPIIHESDNETDPSLDKRERQNAQNE